MFPPPSGEFSSRSVSAHGFPLRRRRKHQGSLAVVVSSPLVSHITSVLHSEEQWCSEHGGEQRVGASGCGDQSMRGRQWGQPSPPAHPGVGRIGEDAHFWDTGRGPHGESVTAAVLWGGTSTQVLDPGAICPHGCPYFAGNGWSPPLHGDKPTPAPLWGLLFGSPQPFAWDLFDGAVSGSELCFWPGST